MKTISRELLETKKKGIEGLTLINTLSSKYFDDFKIQGSVNIALDLDDFVERVKAVTMNNKDAEIVVYSANVECDSSTEAAKKLEAAGFRNVWDYEGGAKDWNAGAVETSIETVNSK